MVTLDHYWNSTTSATIKISLCDSCKKSCKIDRTRNCQTCLVVACDNYEKVEENDEYSRRGKKE